MTPRPALGPLSGWGWRLRRLKRELGLQGPKRLLVEVLAATVYRRLLLLERTLQQPIPEVHAQLPLELARLDQSEAGKYGAFLPGADRSEILRRFEDGHMCFVARCQGHIVAVCWASTKPTWTQFVGTMIPVALGEVYTYGLLTRPELRGKNVAPQLKAYLIGHFRAAGYKRMLAAVEPENWASLRANEKLGYRRYGSICCYRLGPWRRCVYQDGARRVALARSCLEEARGWE